LPDVSTYITRFADSGPGLAVAIKDLINVAGVPTTCGSRAIADGATPALADAACLREIRHREAAGELWLVGKTNLHELAYGTTGINPWFGTPVNPLDASLIPGGSSSGSAVAVAAGEADVALGTDTGGSVRIPAACTGTTGLKTTWGRVPVAGVWPLGPSLDTVGPMARDVAGLVLGMQLLEPGFRPAGSMPTGLPVGRVRLPDVPVDPDVDAAIDDALAAAELDASDIALPGWSDGWTSGDVILSAEAWRADGELWRTRRDGLGELTATRIEGGSSVTVEAEAAARQGQLRWQQELDDVFTDVAVLALPVLATLPPPLDPMPVGLNKLTMPINVAGLPAIAMPIPMKGSRLPASLQLVGPANSEELLLAVAAQVEAATAN
jgi:amidase